MYYILFHKSLHFHFWIGMRWMPADALTAPGKSDCVMDAMTNHSIFYHI
ncbi:MAG: hypothetical protein LJU34_04600 [Oscillospiraceae bacterium]|nr:hypothetical protein [Oscillospiraceae bacterium]